MNKNYPKIYQEDIKVLGRVVSIASENKVAAAEQVFDEKFNYSDLTRYALDATASTTEGLDQYTINRLFGKKLKAFDNAGLIPDVDGFLQNIKINNITVKGGGTFTGDVTFNDNVTVKKKLNVDGGIDSKGIVRCKDVIVGWDGTDNTGYSVKDAIDYLQACCAEVRAMLENLPSGGGVKLTVNPTSLNMNIGDTEEITVTSEPALAGSPTATSSDPSVASVTVSGGKVIVTGKKAGTATITVTWGGATKTIPVTVVDPTPVEDVYEISLSPKTANIDVTDSSTYPVTITATRTKNGTATTEGSIDWRSTNPAIATVSNGVVSPVEGGPNGTVIITAIWNGVSDTCTVTVSGQEVPEPTKYTLQYQVSWPDNPGQSEVWTEQQYYANDTITLPTEPTFTGYTFAGWDGLPSDMKMPSDNLTVLSKWTESGSGEERSIVLDPNEVTLMASDSVEITPHFTNVDPTDCEWSVENSSIASIYPVQFSTKYSVSGASAGTTTVKCTCKSDPTVFGTCEVTVTENTKLLANVDLGEDIQYAWNILGRAYPSYASGTGENTMRFYFPSNITADMWDNIDLEFEGFSHFSGDNNDDWQNWFTITGADSVKQNGYIDITATKHDGILNAFKQAQADNGGNPVYAGNAGGYGSGGDYDIRGSRWITVWLKSKIDDSAQCVTIGQFDCYTQTGQTAGPRNDGQFVYV